MIFPIFITVCAAFYFSLLWSGRGAVEYRAFLKRLTERPKRVRKERQQQAS
jgi:hypothetical protein